MGQPLKGIVRRLLINQWAREASNAPTSTEVTANKQQKEPPKILVVDDNEQALRGHMPQPVIQTFKNSLLRNLDIEIIQRLFLRPVTFELMHEIEFPGNPIKRLYFVEDGMASMTATFKDGTQVEVGMFGHESVIGVSALMGTKRSLNRVYTQIPGRGYSCAVEAARKEFQLGGAFQHLALRYVQAQLLQATQSAGCNAKHNVEQRLARWLLLCADRAHSDTYDLSQDFLGDMLGSSRPTVSLAAGMLKEEKLIDYSRGVIRILDVKRLEKRACECYLIIKNYLDNYTEFDSGITA